MRRRVLGIELDVQRSRLFRDGTEVELEPKAFDLLCYLIDHPNRLVTKQELHREVWKAQRLSSGVTANAIAKLRRALGQPAEAAAPIETVRGRGYILHLPPAAEEPAPVAPRAASAPSTVDDPFVGREVALASLMKKLDRARAGAPSLVLVCGPAGIGKTRLVKELASRSALDGTPTWLGAAYEGEGAPPYWPWVQIVREAKRTAAAAFERALPEGAELLSQWVSPQGALSPSSEAFDPQVVRFRVFDELTRCLGALAADGPKILVLDDLQWADAGSIDLLGYALRALEKSPLLFVATLRDDEPGSRTVEDALSKLSRNATRLRLSGLTEQESRTLAFALRGDDSPSEAHLRGLFERAGGNPFFIRQFLEWWSESGASPEARSDDLPPGARDVIRRRLALLPETARRVLSTAAVMGTRFRASGLCEVVGESTNAVLEALDEASRLSLVVETPGTDEFAFTHALLQETLYQGIDIQTRGALHSRAADSIASDAASTTGSQLGERARHLIYALPSRLEEAVRTCESAARAAQLSAGFERATDLLLLALNKLEAEGSSAHEQARLWIDLGDNYFFSATLDVAWDAYQRAAELARSVEDIETLARLAPLLVRCVNMGSGDADFARALIDDVLRALPKEALRDRGRTLAQKAQLALELSAEERNALLDEAAACADGPLDRIAIAYARTMLRDPTTLESNLRAADELLRLSDADNPGAGAIRYRTLHRLGAYITRYVCAVIACDLQRADEAHADMARLAASTHMRAVEVVLALIRAGRAWADGRLDDLASIVTSPMVVGASDTSTITEAFRSYQLLLAEARGAMAMLEKLVLPPLPESATAAPRHHTDKVIGRAYLYAQTGRHELAREMLARASRRAIERMPVLYGDLGVLSGLAVVYSDLGDQAGMRLVYDKLKPFEGRNALLPTFAYRGAVDHYLGILANKLGDAACARSHLRAALTINRQLGMPRQARETEELLASLG